MLRVKLLLKGTGILLGGAFVIVICVYAVNFLILARLPLNVSIHDMAFIEGILLLLVGILFLLGSGGINLATLKALFLASAADAAYNAEYSPSEIFQKDAWRPRSFQKLALATIFSGIILISLYFIFGL